MFDTLTLADALSVVQHMRAADVECLEAVTTISTRDAFAVNRWQTEGAAWVMRDMLGPLAIGGISLSVPWVGVVWMVCTDRMGFDSWKKLIRWARRILVNASQAIPRIECHVLGTWPQAQDFAERMGFVLEGTRRRAGRDGQDILTFVYGEPDAHH